MKSITAEAFPSRAMLAVAILTLASACRSLEKDWQDAKAADSPASYQSFIKEHPKGEFSDQARARVAELEWIAVEKSPSIDGYNKFKTRYPKSPHVTEIPSRLEKLRWTQSVSENNDSSYRAFLKDYPSSAHKDDALGRLAELRKKEFVSNAKAGNLEAVKQALEQVDDDQRSRAFMMALYGALHTSMNFGYQGGHMVTGAVRSSPVRREVYVEMMQLLVAAGADTKRYDFKSFDSVAFKQHQEAEERKTSLDAVAKSGGRVTTVIEFGARQTLDLVPAGSGISARKVAEVEKAKDVLTLLGQED
jgi:outer membrane protein assembly factor BamD (BamD/ComL family)